MNNERDIIMNTQPYAEDLGVCDSKGKATVNAPVQDVVYTPGPWRVVRDRENHWGMIEVVGSSILTIRGFTIATNVSAQKAAQIERDANLIAAAPQMLEALRLIANLDYKNAATNLSALNAVNIARKAIRESTGEVV